MDGITAAVEIRNRLGIRSVFLADHVDEIMQARAVAAAPVAVLDKTSSMSVIADALCASDCTAADNPLTPAARVDYTAPAQPDVRYALSASVGA